jgi:DNA-binding response OmpR family regulator
MQAAPFILYLMLRRANIANEKKLTLGGLVMNADETDAYFDGKGIPLTVKEFQVLYKLLSYPKKTFTRNKLMDEFWGMETETTPCAVDVYITTLREQFIFIDPQSSSKIIHAHKGKTQ